MIRVSGDGWIGYMHHLQGYTSNSLDSYLCLFMSTGTYLFTVLSTPEKSSGNEKKVYILIVISTEQVTS